MGKTQTPVKVSCIACEAITVTLRDGETLDMHVQRVIDSAVEYMGERARWLDMKRDADTRRGKYHG